MYLIEEVYRGGDTWVDEREHVLIPGTWGIKDRLKIPLTYCNKLEKFCGKKDSHSIQEHAELPSESGFDRKTHNIRNNRLILLQKVLRTIVKFELNIS